MKTDFQIAMDDLANAEKQLDEREQSLKEVKEQYDLAVMEKQRLTDAANVCLRKMNTATTLINGLGGEKIRWTQQSKEFKEQLGKNSRSITFINFDVRQIFRAFGWRCTRSNWFSFLLRTVQPRI